jgi:uroporphyrin-III C-methyltransferase
MPRPGKVILVGAGPGDPDLLTVKAMRAIQSAEVVVFDRLVGHAVLDLIPDGARRVDVGKETGRHPLPQDQINRLLVDLAQDGRDVVRLKGGDPFIFGRGGEEALALAEAGIEFEIVPGITAASGCAAVAGIPLTHRGLAESVRLVTGHRQEDRDLDLNWSSLADPRCTLVVYMGVASAQRLAGGLRGAGLSGETPVAIIERGTTPQQRTFTTTLDNLVADIERWQPQPPALLIIGQVVTLGLVPSVSSPTQEAAQ